MTYPIFFGLYRSLLKTCRHIKGQINELNCFTVFKDLLPLICVVSHQIYAVKFNTFCLATAFFLTSKYFKTHGHVVPNIFVLYNLQVIPIIL